jgi:hypothetical protein
MQNGKLLDIGQLSKEKNTIQQKIARNQSAYIVEYLLENYGIDKLKQLWNKGMNSFEGIYNIEFDNVTANIDQKLNNKYRFPIQFDYEEFEKDCICMPDDGWLSAYNPESISNAQLNRMKTREYGTLRFTVDTILSIEERNEAVVKTKEYIAQNLAIINELEFKDSIHIYLVPDRDRMFDLLGGRIGGVTGLRDEHNPENSIYSVYNKTHNPLKHEVMHIVTMLKWGNEMRVGIMWLSEGLATFACPESENCDGHTFEERYVYLLQSGKLLSLDALTDFEVGNDNIFRKKQFYNQSAYIVEYLFEKYGIEKIKILWQSGMEDFEKIYGLTIENMIGELEKELMRKYPDPIDFSWEEFNKRCIE